MFHSYLSSMNWGNVYHSGIKFLSLTANGAKRRKQSIFGTINRNAHANHCVYACNEAINIAGARTRLTAILNAPRSQFTFLSATRNVSLVVVLFLVKKYTNQIINTQNTRRIVNPSCIEINESILWKVIYINDDSYPTFFN